MPSKLSVKTCQNKPYDLTYDLIYWKQAGDLALTPSELKIVELRVEVALLKKKLVGCKCQQEFI